MVAKLKVSHATTARCEVQVLINGELTGTLNMRNAHLPAFILRLKPHEILVDQENTTTDLRRRVRGFPQLVMF